MHCCPISSTQQFQPCPHRNPSSASAQWNQVRVPVLGRIQSRPICRAQVTLGTMLLSFTPVSVFCQNDERRRPHTRSTVQTSSKEALQALPISCLGLLICNALSAWTRTLQRLEACCFSLTAPTPHPPANVPAACCQSRMQ